MRLFPGWRCSCSCRANPARRRCLRLRPPLIRYVRRAAQNRCSNRTSSESSVIFFSWFSLTFIPVNYCFYPQKRHAEQKRVIVGENISSAACSHQNPHSGLSKSFWPKLALPAMLHALLQLLLASLTKGELARQSVHDSK